MADSPPVPGGSVPNGGPPRNRRLLLGGIGLLVVLIVAVTIVVTKPWANHSNNPSTTGASARGAASASPTSPDGCSLKISRPGFTVITDDNEPTVSYGYTISNPCQMAAIDLGPCLVPVVGAERRALASGDECATIPELLPGQKVGIGGMFDRHTAEYDEAPSEVSVSSITGLTVKLRTVLVRTPGATVKHDIFRKPIYWVAPSQLGKGKFSKPRYNAQESFPSIDSARISLQPNGATARIHFTVRTKITQTGNYYADPTVYVIYKDKDGAIVGGAQTHMAPADYHPRDDDRTFAYARYPIGRKDLRAKVYLLPAR